LLLTRDFALHAWQAEAVNRWIAGSPLGPHTGTLEIFTGGGKTLIALACAATVAQRAPEMKLVVVVPTQALAHQWKAAIAKHSTIAEGRIGLLGAGKSATLETCDVLVAVINSASAKLEGIVAAQSAPVMLVVDECHRAGAESFRRVLATPAAYRLGLSATPERDEVDEHGEPLEYDEQIVAQSLGPIVYRFGLKDARVLGWLPTYEIHHHGVPLDAAERREYEDLTHQVDDVKKRMESIGGQTRQAHMLVRRGDELGTLARSYVAVTSKRKDLLYKARSRNVVAGELVREAYRDPVARRMIVFHERVAEAQALYEAIAAFIPKLELAIEHSQLPEAERRSGLARFRSGDARVLVSVKSLIEGIDVPEADVGISVASSASVRQRIQSLGRVLRRSFDKDAAPKHALMHVVYVSDTVDEQIYAKEDWSDITGEANNVYWRWADGGTTRVRKDAPPREPQPTEEMMWESFGRALPATLPLAWPGSINGQEYSVDTRGNVTNAMGSAIVNAQGAGKMVALVRKSPGGRFRVTPKHRLVLVSRFTGSGLAWSLAGRLAEAFEAEATADATAQIAPEELAAGDAYPGPLDAAIGTFKLRQKDGGNIERRYGRERVWALRDDNARRTLAAWRAMKLDGMDFFVSSSGVAWFRRDGRAVVLAHVPNGFAWPERDGAAS
jgi:superfamily II DNA or RNA helicase